jgi:hypothetical protein
MKTFWVSLLGLIVVTSCASVGAVIEGGKQFTTGVVDGAVKGSATVVSAVADDVVSVGEFAVNTTAGIVETVAEEVDKQTDELQSKPE